MDQPKDHYVAETYLKHFTNNEDKVWTYSKKWLKAYEKSPAAICYELGGSDNPYLDRDRAIEDYLRPIENNWKNSVRFLASSNDSLSHEYLDAKIVVASYMAYLMFHTPAAVKGGQDQLSASLKSVFKILYSSGHFPPPPAHLKEIIESTMEDLIFSVDPKFPKALATPKLSNAAERLFKSPMLVFKNNSERPFLTSDHPLCHWYADGPSSQPILFLPLSPTMGILSKPFENQQKRESYDHSLDGTISKPEFVDTLNGEVVKHAEETVISNAKCDYVLDLVTKFKNFRFEVSSTRIPTDGGETIISRSRTVEHPDQ